MLLQFVSGVRTIPIKAPNIQYPIYWSVKGKGNCIAVMEHHVTAAGQQVSLAIWDQTVLPATGHKWAQSPHTSQSGRYSIYLPRRDGRL